MKRHPHADPVTPELREAVLERDHYTCVAWLLGAAGCREPLTLDHIQDGYGRMGKRAPSDREHLVTLCAFHHLETGWATSHRPELRDYLRRVNTREGVKS